MFRSRRLVAYAACAAVVFSLLPRCVDSAPRNPLMEPSTLPFGAPPFDTITDADYLPAFEAGMARQRREVAAIANDPAPPTFANTIVALEKSGQLLDRVNLVFSGVESANTDDTLEHVNDVVAPQQAALQDEIYLNQSLFARVKELYAGRASLHLDAESLQLLKVDYQQFVLAGANLAPAQRAQVSTIDQRLATLQSAYDRKLLAATAAAAPTIDGKKYSLQNTTQQPALVSMANRASRKKLFEASWNRTERGDADDTRSTIAEIAKLRAERAALMGYPNYASYALVDQMAKTPQAVEAFLSRMIPAERVRAKEEAAQLQALIERTGGRFKLKPWDWAYYENKLREAKLGLNDAQIRPYFELNGVLRNGLFYAANQLYGITFKERHDIPVYQKDVRVFEVYDGDGKPLGLIYFDFFKRDNKQGGAWMSNFVNQSRLLGAMPVVYNVENIPKPPAGEPALLTIGEVTGMFHEFGHALNGLFAVQEYPSLSGAQTARDFVEYPSQFNEHWALYPQVLEHYAFDYKTHQPMPQAMIQKIERARTFGGAYALGESLAADQLDMAWHSLPASAPKANVDAFERHALAASGTNFEAIPPRYRSSYFTHIWTAGYAAGYYAYMWSEMLDDDTYQWFLDHGGLTRANGRRFRDLILSMGHSEDYGPMFRSFYGEDPQVGPLLHARGLIGPPGG